MKRADGKVWPYRSLRHAFDSKLQDLISGERQRSRAHIALIRRADPEATPDRVAQLITSRWVKASSIEGGITGSMGFAGIPLNFLLLTYCQIALIVSVAEAYGVSLEGETGETAVLGVLGRAHGAEDVLRASPRVLGSIAKALALRHGLSGLGRWIPLISSPISARLNERDMKSLAEEAFRRFGQVYRIG